MSGLGGLFAGILLIVGIVLVGSGALALRKWNQKFHPTPRVGNRPTVSTLVSIIGGVVIVLDGVGLSDVGSELQLLGYLGAGGIVGALGGLVALLGVGVIFLAIGMFAQPERARRYAVFVILLSATSLIGGLGNVFGVIIGVVGGVLGLGFVYTETWDSTKQGGGRSVAPAWDRAARPANLGPTPIGANPKGRTCPNCGQGVTNLMRKCPSCGSPLSG